MKGSAFWLRISLLIFLLVLFLTSLLAQPGGGTESDPLQNAAFPEVCYPITSNTVFDQSEARVIHNLS